MRTGEAFAQGAEIYERIREEEALLKKALLPLAACPESAGHGSGSQVRWARRSPVHAQTPLLFATAFPFMEEQKLLELCRLERLYTEHLLALDRALDRGERLNPLDLLLSSLRQAESLLGLYSWFPPGHLFWTDFWERASRTWRAVLLERIRHGHNLEEAYSFDAYETVARDKTALLSIFALAPTYVSKDEDLRRVLGRSLDEHHKGLVLLDDLQDWREDYSRGHYTYLLTRLLLENGLEGSVRSGAKPDLSTVGRLLYGTGAAEEHLGLAESCFRKAEADLEEGLLPHWIALNRRYRALCVCLRERVRRFRIGKDRGQKDPGGRLAAGERPERTRARRDHTPALEVQDGTHDLFVEAAREGLLLCRPVLQEPEAIFVTLGRWDGLPAHFHLVEGRRVRVGIQVFCPGEGNSNRRRPLETETVLACVRAQRILSLGRERTLLESCFVAGLALGACMDLRSRQEPWRSLALEAVEWQWCQKHEWLLWEMLEEKTAAGFAVSEREDGFSAPFPEFGAPAPRGAVLYLSLRVFEEASACAVVEDPGWMLEKWKEAEIRSALGWPRFWGRWGDG